MSITCLKKYSWQATRVHHWLEPMCESVLVTLTATPLFCLDEFVLVWRDEVGIFDLCEAETPGKAQTLPKPTPLTHAMHRGYRSQTARGISWRRFLYVYVVFMLCSYGTAIPKGQMQQETLCLIHSTFWRSPMCMYLGHQGISCFLRLAANHWLTLTLKNAGAPKWKLCQDAQYQPNQHTSVAQDVYNSFEAKSWYFMMFMYN